MTSLAKRRLSLLVMLVVGLLLVTSSISDFGSFSHGGEAVGASGSGSDTTPPTTTIEFGHPSHSAGGRLYINTNTTVYINGTDASGINFTRYEVWRDSDGDDVFETLEDEGTVYDGDAADADISMNISIHITVSSTCSHRIAAYSVDTHGNVESYGGAPLREEWRYNLQPKTTHWANGGILVFGSSPAIANLNTDTPHMEVVCGSDEVNNYYPETPSPDKEGGIWRCWSANGSILWATPTETDEARSSPAICDIDGDGTLEIAGGTTSGWNVEVMDSNGSFLWSFPARRITLGSYCWHSSPALVDIVDDNPNLEGLELVIGNNPYHSVWCFDGDNSDGVDDGITLPRNADGSSPLFPWTQGDLGVEGEDWDVLWVFENSQPILATPAVGDIDKNGYKEVVIGSLDGYIYAIDGPTGAKKWQHKTGEAVYSSAALANLDGDAYLEVIVGSTDTYLYCLDGKTSVRQWRYKTGGAIYSSPAIGDVDGDGQVEIVFASLDGTIYCLSRFGIPKWKYTTGAPIYSSPALAADGSVSASPWPMFRHDCARTGVYTDPVSSGERLFILIGSDDGYLYKLNGNGTLHSRFLTTGPVHTSPSIADIDGDGFLEIPFSDWGSEPGWGTRDVFWCLEEPNAPAEEYVHVDHLPPITEKTVGAEEEYNITDETRIWLNGTDNSTCAAGIRNVHYEIWWDSNGDDVVDTKVSERTVGDNEAGDEDSSLGNISVTFTMNHYGIHEIRWYATDWVGNREETHYQEHMVTLNAPRLVVTKEDNPDPVDAGGALTYVINVSNTGTETATNVVIVDDYDETKLVITNTGGGMDSGSQITWQVASIAPGNWVHRTVQAQVKTPMANGTVIPNHVNATCSEDSSDDTTIYTTVVSAPDLSITKVVSDVNGAPVRPGDVLRYTVSVSNTGNMNHG
ncbi:MAG: PQQ-binding-like beta-propeller repeat protein, partial [Candidatus Thermoplasmatota archaeon]|nr:PQQ-binding-like beta-propeller repeat protein [Candidatus Thermoplasmatota archaeon]